MKEKKLTQIQKKLKEQLKKEIVSFFRINEEEFLICNQHYREIKSFYKILFELTENENRRVRWKTYWLLQFFPTTATFDIILGYLESQLKKEKDTLVKFFIGISIRELIMLCTSLKPWIENCIDEYSYLFLEVYDYTNIRINGKGTNYYSKEFGYIKTFIVAEPDHYEELSRHLSSDTKHLRYDIFDLLGNSEDVEAVQFLENTLDEPGNINYQSNIILALSKIERSNPKWLETLHIMFKNRELDPDQIEEYVQLTRDLLIEEGIERLKHQVPDKTPLTHEDVNDLLNEFKDSIINSLRKREEKGIDYLLLETEFRKLLNISDENLKGKALEDFSFTFFSEILGLQVAMRNLNLGDSEIDIVLRNQVNRADWIQLNSPNIFVECKNRKNKIGSNDIRNFYSKIQTQSAVRVGFFIAPNGFDNNARKSIRDAQSQNIIIGLIDKENFADFFKLKLDPLDFLQSCITKSIS